MSNIGLTTYDAAAAWHGRKADWIGSWN